MEPTAPMVALFLGLCFLYLMSVILKWVTGDDDQTSLNIVAGIGICIYLSQCTGCISWAVVILRFFFTEGYIVYNSPREKTPSTGGGVTQRLKNHDQSPLPTCHGPLAVLGDSNDWFFYGWILGINFNNQSRQCNLIKLIRWLYYFI